MIVGIGTDIVHIPRIARLFQQHGSRFASKILHPREQATLQELHPVPRKVEFLAGRWAAKEAAFKALPSVSPRLQFPDLFVAQSSIDLCGRARGAAEARGIKVRRTRRQCL